MDFANFLKSQNYQRLIDEDFAWFISDSFVEGLKDWPSVCKWLGPIV